MMLILVAKIDVTLGKALHVMELCEIPRLSGMLPVRLLLLRCLLKRGTCSMCLIV